MNEQTVLKECLDEAVHESKKSHNLLRKSDFDKIFQKLSLDSEKLKLIQEFLLGKNVKIIEDVAFDDEYSKLENEKFGDLDELAPEDIKAIDFYYEDLKNIPELSEKEINEVCQKAIGGDEEAKAKLASIYLPKVVDMAKLYANQGVPIEDLIGEGNIGLLTGIGILECVEGPSEVEGHLGRFIMEAMDGLIAEENEDEKLVLKLAEGLKKTEAKPTEDFDVFNGDELLRAAFKELEEEE